MKKLFSKDNQKRLNFKTVEKSRFILKAISKNLNFFYLLRWNAFAKLKQLNSWSFVSTSNRCVLTYNKKRFNKLTTFSRHLFLKNIRSGYVYGFKKSSW